MMMDCNQATELLPWLLNDTLEAGERLQVLGHLRSCDSCRAALADTRMAWQIFDWHPEPAALVAYVERLGGDAGNARHVRHARHEGTAGDLGDEIDPAGVGEHLASCPRCAAELELVRTSRLLADPAAPEDIGRIAIMPMRRKGAAEGGEAATPGEAAARRAWRRSALAASLVGLLTATGWFASARQAHDLERRLGAASASPAASAGQASPAAQAARPSPAAANPPAPAASVPSGRGEAADLKRRAGEAEARLAALAAQNRQLQQQVAELGRTAADLSQRSAALAAPQLPAAPGIESDVVVSDLAPAEQTERGAAAPAATAIPLSSGAATLLLHTRHRDSYQSYELEVRDAQGRLVGAPTRVLRVPGSQDSFEEFDITLRRGALAPGAYTLRLFGRPAPRTGAAAGTPGSEREALETYSIRVS
ncbi:MAG TPA: zf-HC2 domain-containing protein [Thermoanaerobaculia bacterium]|jgi:hypothetical protein|nr:zf-HC2 domain-containing protein [Thermoanaerobaculia bacterium]